MPGFRIEVDDPRRDDVRALMARHLEFANEHSPPQDVHALDVGALTDPAVTFYSSRDSEGQLVAVGALKALEARHGELKSMHTAAEARGRGAGRAMLDTLLAEARRRRWERVSLETGTMAAFAPARRMYAAAGFVPCPPFADYPDSPNSICMTLLMV